MALLGLVIAEQEEVVGGVRDFSGAVVAAATVGVFVKATLLPPLLLFHGAFGGEEAKGFLKGDVAPMGLLALPHSASTSAMMSPPAIESKVRREEMSASRQLRLLSPGVSGGGGDVGSGGGACSLDLLTSSPAAEFEGVVAALPCTDELLRASLLSAVGLWSRERGWDLGVSVRSSLMISTLLARDDIRSGLGGASSLSSLSLDFNFTLPKRPLSPRRCRGTGWDTVLTRRLPVPLRPPLSKDRKLRDLAELAEEMEGRPSARARTDSSPRVSSSACSIPLSASCSPSGASVSADTSSALPWLTGDLLFPPSPLLRIEKMLPGFRLPNSLNPFLIFPLGWFSLGGGGSAFSVCTSILSLCLLPPPPVTYSCDYSPASGKGICIQPLSAAWI